MTSFSSKTLSDRAGTGPTSDRKAGSTLKKGTLPSSGATMTTARNRSSSRRTGGIDWESRYWRMERDAVRLAEGNDELLGMLSTCEQRVAVRQEEQKTVDLEAQFRESVLRDEAKMMLYGEEFVLRRVAEEANRVSPQAEIHAASQSLATLEMVVETELEKGSESVRTFLLAELRERDSQLEASRKALVDKQSELRALQNTMLAEQKVVYPPVAAKVEISRRSEDWQEAEREMQCYRADVSYLADEYVNARSELGEMRRQQLYSDSQQRSVEAANQALAEAIVSETEAYKEEARQLVIARDKRPVRWIDRPGSTREFIEDGKKYVQASLVNFRKVTSNHSATRAEGAERARSVRHDDALGAKHDKIRSDEKAALTKEQAEASARLAEEEQDAINSVLFSGDNSQQSLIKYKKAKIRFMEAARVNDVKQVQDFVNLCGGWATNVIDGFRRTALMYAGAAGSMDVVQFLTGFREMEVDGRDIANKTALHHVTKSAVSGRHFDYEEVLMMLVEFKASLNFRDRHGHTALSYSISKGQETGIGMTAMLIRAQADVNIQDNRGLTPLDESRLNNNTTAAELLLERGALPGDRIRKKKASKRRT